MTTLAARRAVMRWAWRLVRREWRQQVLVMLLITFTVAASLLAAIVAFNAPSSADGVFGSADHLVRISGPQPDALRAVATELSDRYPGSEATDHETVTVPGSVETVDLRDQDPAQPLGASKLALRSGRYPASAGEVAVTDGAASLLGLQVGDRSALAGAERTVVGIVENPADLNDEFVLAAPGTATRPEMVSLLVDGHSDELGDRPGRVGQLRTSDRGVTALYETRWEQSRRAAAFVILTLDTMAMLLVSLIAAAAFVVVAQRRQRQLGMLAATGATRSHVRLAMVGHGLAVGVIGAAVGNAVALVTWFSASSVLEPLVHHRVNPADVPVNVLVFGSLIAIVTTTGAAWWPARTISRVPIVRALSGRPAAAPRVHRSALLGIAFLGAGVVTLIIGIHKTGDASPFAAISGPIEIVLGVLFLCPIAIQALRPLARRMPVTARLALRDLSRYQARAAGALAAISLGLGIAATAVIVTAAATPPASAGNLSNRQLLFSFGRREFVPDASQSQTEAIEKQIDEFAASIGATVYPLDVAIAGSGTNESSSGGGKPIAPGPNGEQGHPTIMFGTKVPHGIRTDSPNPPYVATPALLAHLGIDSSTIGSDIELISPDRRDLVLLDVGSVTRDIDATPLAHTLRYRDRGYSEQPKTLLTPAAVAAHGWKTQRAGWFVETDRPLTSAQRGDARTLAAGSGIVVTTRDAHRALSITRSLATAAGMLLTLAILAMTIGLIRGESARDLQTLTATGATSFARRTITATTSAALALLGTLLGLLGAYIALIAGYSDNLHPLTRVPTSNLVVMLVGLPSLAALGGWLFAGRQPPTISRQALE
jgi:putative ABC transport system permease protein